MIKNEINIIIYCGVILANLLGCQLCKTAYNINSYENSKTYNFWLFLCIHNNCNFWMLYSLIIKDIYILSSCYSSWLGSLAILVKLLQYQTIKKPINKNIINFQLVTLLYILVLASLETLKTREIINYNKNYNNYRKHLLYGITCNSYQLLYYTSPLIELKNIIETRDISSLYMPMMIVGMANTFCWALYAIMNNDIFQIIPNFCALFFFILQWIIYILIKYILKKNNIPLSIQLNNELISDV